MFNMSRGGGTKAPAVSMVARFILGLGLAVPHMVVAYTCPGSSTNYVTDCTPADTTGQLCLRPVPDSGCCFGGVGFCSAGTCYVPAGSTQTACNDGNSCTVDVCRTRATALDPVCTYPLRPDGADCDLDEDLCTVDACDQGRCWHSPPDVSCAQCAACNAATGRCENVSNLDMQACDDGKDCTTGDICVNGSCTGTGLRARDYVCTDGDPCTPGRCNGSDGLCHNRQRTLDFTHCAADGPAFSQTHPSPPGLDAR